MSTGQNMEVEPNPDPQTNEQDPLAAGREEADEVIVAEKNARGEDVAPVSAVLKYKGESKAAKAEVARLTAEIGKLQGVQQALEQYSPILERIRQDPSIMERARQPQQQPAEDDVEAIQLAEDMGLLAADSSLDVKRARKMLDFLDRRNDRRIDQRVAPLANTTAAQIAESHRQRATTLRKKDGSLAASEESINQVYGMLPAELLANPSVAALMPIMAAGLDAMTGRKPAAQAVREYDEPFFSEAAGGGRGPRSVLTDDDKAFAQKLGLDGKTYEKQVQQMQTNGRRGVALE
jgi:hypothetical protein